MVGLSKSKEKKVLSTLLDPRLIWLVAMTLFGFHLFRIYTLHIDFGDIVEVEHLTFEQLQKGTPIRWRNWFLRKKYFRHIFLKMMV